ncbi:hypothetical protein [Kineococcus rubinsiae]|uniref:hypothetical protein n=1 Tax=Kineococcus rubinsiae TaxID=2609562 RepID=UPI001431AB3E|nr:hypothetical protein [Kineococcus rubinsiae]NIZ91005.1 hypothetical protein [Kineococcus rubinsiae]
MLVWLNGPHGVGGSSTAAALRALVPGTRAVELPRVATRLGRVVDRLPRRFVPDVASLPPASVSAARAALVGACVLAHTAPPHREDRLVVVAATVLDPDRLDTLLDDLRTRLDVLHVTLHASAPELARRITRDAGNPSARARRLARIPAYERAAPALAGHGPVISTDRRSVEEVAAVVAALVARRREG